MITANPKQFWNSICNKPNWKDYILPRRSDDEFDSEGLLEAIQIAKSAPSDIGTCIDYGCGIGRITKHFKKYARRMIGLDICKKFIEEAKKRDSSEYYLTDEFEESSVADFIYCISVLQHNDNRNCEEIMRRIYNLLKVGGLAYITFSTGSLYRVDDFVRVFTEDEIRKLTKDFSNIHLMKGNLVRYIDKSLGKESEFNEFILLAMK